jgi:hypothetical protein
LIPRITRCRYPFASKFAPGLYEYDILINIIRSGVETILKPQCGHRCPAYFIRREGEVQDANDGAYWVVGRTLEEARGRAALQ